MRRNQRGSNEREKILFQSYGLNSEWKRIRFSFSIPSLRVHEKWHPLLQIETIFVGWPTLNLYTWSFFSSLCLLPTYLCNSASNDVMMLAWGSISPLKYKQVYKCYLWP